MDERDSNGAPRRGRSSSAWRWTVRVVVVLGVLVGAIAGWYWWQIRAAEDRLAKVVGEIRQRGEPLAWADFAPEPLAPNDNAATYYRRAYAVYTRVDPNLLTAGGAEGEGAEEDVGDIVSELVADPNLRATRAEEIREFLARHEEVFELCRRAGRCEGADWGVNFTRPAVYVVLPNLNEIRMLGSLLCLRAAASIEAGRSEEGLRALRDVQSLGRLSRPAPSLIAYVVSSSLDEMCVQTLEQALPRVRYDGNRAAVPAAAKGLIADLLADTEFPRHIMGERSFIHDTLERIRTGRMPIAPLPGAGGVRRLMLQVAPGLLAEDQAVVLELMGFYVRAAEANSLPEARAVLARAPRGTDRLGGLAGALMPTFDRAYALHHHTVALRRLAATGIAVRLHRLDHGDKRPGGLAELAPTYIPAVPDDPFAAPPRPVAFAPDKAVLYSVGSNGKDDGGRCVRLSNGRLDPSGSPDLVFDLDPNLPGAP